MSNQKKPLFTLPVAIQAATAAGLMVTGLGALPTAGGRVLGCLAEACTVVGPLLPVDVLGTSVGIAAAAFAADVPLMVDATGKLLTATGTNVVVARSIDAALALGDRVEVLLLPS